MELYNHQKMLIDKNPDRCLICHSTGTGKSLTSIELSKGKGSVLFIVPKALKAKWERDTRETVITKETFRRDWDKLQKYDVVVWDEAHHAAGMKSKMSKSLYSYFKKHNTKYRYLLTATAYTSSAWSVYVLAKHLGYNINYIDFKNKFFQDRYIGRRVIPEMRPGMEDEIAKLVSMIGDIVHLDECADIPDQIFENEIFEMTKEQEIEKKNIIEINPIVRFTKYHQIENGTLKSDGYTENKTIENNKLERIIDLCKEIDKIAIICRYNLQIELYKNILQKEYPNKNIYIINGETKDRDSVVQKINNNKECVVLINASCSEGYELPSISTMIFASMSFSYVNYKQMVGRILRLNSLHKNLYIHLLIKDGIDESIYDAVKNKQNFDIAIYAKNNQSFS